MGLHLIESHDRHFARTGDSEARILLRAWEWGLYPQASCHHALQSFGPAARPACVCQLYPQASSHHALQSFGPAARPACVCQALRARCGGWRVCIFVRSFSQGRVAPGVRPRLRRVRLCS